MQPVRADEQIEASRHAVLEGHPNALGVLVDRADRVPEHVLDVVAGCLVEDPRELAAHDLDVSIGDPGGQPLEVDLDRSLPGKLERELLSHRPG